MGAASETIVREFFKLHGFFVRQQRKYIAPTRREDEEIDYDLFKESQLELFRPKRRKTK